MILLVFTTKDVHADEIEILTLLKAGNMDKLDLLREDASGVEKLFLDGIFETDGAGAVMIFQEIYDDYQESILAWEALDRIYQYNYASGYYGKASELELLLRERPPIQIPMHDISPSNPGDIIASKDSSYSLSTSTEALLYWIQCGAFSSSDNAELMAAKIRRSGYNVTVFDQKPGVRDYYLVRVGGYSNKDEALDQSLIIKQQLGIDCRVVTAEK